MRRSSSWAIIVALTAAIASTAAAEDGEKARPADSEAVDRIEAEIVRAMQGGMGASFSELRQQIRALDPEARRLLGVAVRPGVYQWRFSGVHPADTLLPQSLEYIVSTEEKNYESLLVVEGREMERLQRFGPALSTLRRRLPGAEMSVQLCWSEAGRVRTVDIWEIFAGLEDAQVKEFFKALESTPFGLGAINLEADRASLPKKKTPAQVIITLRVPHQ